MLARSKWKRFGVVVLAAVTVTAVTGCSALNSLLGGSSETESTYIEEQVMQRDISNYSSFTGSITPVTEEDVVPDLTGVKVTELYVSEGDEVKEGDVLMILDDTSLQQQIDQKEISISNSEASAAFSLKQAQINYDNYIQDLEDGLNSSMMSAESSIESAYNQLISAQNSYNNEVALNNQDLSSTILSATQQIESAYQSLQSAYLTMSQIEESWEQQLEDGLTVTDAVQLEHDQQVESQELQIQSAQTSYNNALTNYEVAVLSEDSQLTSYYNSLISAQQSYLNAIDSYNATVRSIQQQIQSYQLQIEQAELNSDMTASYYELDLLYDQLEDCTVTAPMDGVVTTLSVSVGSIVASDTASMVISSFDEFVVEISINEYNITSINEGDEVTITVDAIDKEYEGYISSISRVAAVSSGVSYFTAQVKFDGDDDARSGMSCEIKLTTSEALEAVSVSSAAIQTASDGSSYVLMYADDSNDVENLIQRTVTLGVTDGTYTEITDGLYLGETVLYDSVAAAAAAAASSSDDDSGFGDMGGGAMGGGGGGGGMPGGGGGGMP